MNPFVDTPCFEIRTSPDDAMSGIRIYGNGRIEGAIVDRLRASGSPCLIINSIPILFSSRSDAFLQREHVETLLKNAAKAADLQVKYDAAFPPKTARHSRRTTA